MDTSGAESARNARASLALAVPPLAVWRARAVYDVTRRGSSGVKKAR